MDMTSPIAGQRLLKLKADLRAQIAKHLAIAEGRVGIFFEQGSVWSGQHYKYKVGVRVDGQKTPDLQDAALLQTIHVMVHDALRWATAN